MEYGKVRVKSNYKLSDGVFILSAEGAELPKQAGQFYMLKASDFSEPFLPRPISVFDVRDGCVDFLIEVVGKGTQALMSLKAGDELEMFGALGNGFPDEKRDAVLIGGGTGCAPLLYLAKTLGKRKTIYLGFNQRDAVSDYLLERFDGICDKVVVIYGGFVTEDVIYSEDAVYYACGREAMMKVLKQKADDFGTKMYLSYGNRMACGVGACVCCVVKTVDGNKRACKEGPVFDSRLLV
ncbi:MAG: dihydroorotate dehydrogenase electron transfer subunit [Clostridia bacterium]|nr:dihydroorotate dehydrogenase electron transfer subunit [Clostridia bacterium]